MRQTYNIAHKKQRHIATYITLIGFILVMALLSFGVNALSQPVGTNYLQPQYAPVQPVGTNQLLNNPVGVNALQGEGSINL